MKFCRDCRHAPNLPIEDSDRWMCSHPKAVLRRTDLVSGRDMVVPLTCKQARNLGPCDEDARFFEPRDIGFGT